MKLYITKEFDLSNGRQVLAYIALNAVYEPNYGADADGNRGMPHRFIDSYDFEVKTELSDKESLELEALVQDYVMREHS